MGARWTVALLLGAALGAWGCGDGVPSEGQGRGGLGNAQWAGEAPPGLRLRIGLPAVSGPGQAGAPGGTVGGPGAAMPPPPGYEAPPVNAPPPPELLTTEPGPGPGQNTPNSGFPGPGIGMYGNNVQMVAPQQWQLLGWGGAQAWMPRVQCEGLYELERRLEELGHRLPALDSGETRYQPEGEGVASRNPGESDEPVLNAQVDALAARVAQLGAMVAEQQHRADAERKVAQLYQRVKRLRARMARHQRTAIPPTRAPEVTTLDITGTVQEVSATSMWVRDENGRLYEIQVPSDAEIQHKRRSYQRNAIAVGDEVETLAFEYAGAKYARRVVIAETPAEKALRVRLRVRPVLDW